jgi:cytochrome c biogenesis protein CcmG/thiol:disulfide interchange protein DsbE
LSGTKSRKRPRVAKPQGKPRRNVFVFAAIIVVVVAVAAYIVVQPQIQPGSPGDIAQDFTLRVVTADGLSDQTVTLSSFRGQVVVLEFMVSWCKVCQAAAPSMEYLKQKYQGSGVVFLSVAGTLNGATAESTAGFIRQFNSTWTYVLDTDNSAFARYKVDSTPTFLVLDRSGKILSRFQGLVSTDIFSQAIDLALT